MDCIAVIGMAGRFPGAPSPADFWSNLKNGVESISRFSPDQLEVPDAHLLAQAPNYVLARSILDDVDLFDAGFFGIYPKEAELMDPQHRIFLECCWEAFEDAGHDPQTIKGPAGVFAGCSQSTYFLKEVCRSSPGFVEEYVGAYQVGNYPAMMGSNPDFLATRVAYKLNLKGPSFSLAAGCSTSLIAVSLACQNLLSYQCDFALAGGVSITLPQRRGYFYDEGGMVSPDGHCRTFDAKAQGTVFGSGSGVVLLRRLEDALKDGDHIYAVIKGYALNNDGSAKVGYTAPSIEGQARVIALAQAVANVPPETIGYVEAHGTATPLGDPIEVAALTQAFRARTRKTGFCALGTAKTNVGHLDIAAGITGFIKTAFSLHHKLLPPVLHFEKPNPKIDLANSPFFVNTALTEWKAGATPRRAGVSAFGVGGTNAHVILEEAPPVQPVAPVRPLQPIILSARSMFALDAATSNLAAYLRNHPEIQLRDAAYTLQVGRRHFAHRRCVICSDLSDAIAALAPDSKRALTACVEGKAPSVVFMFPGQGAQSVNMASGLYRAESVFRDELDDCAEFLREELGCDLREILFPVPERQSEAGQLLGQTRFTQPALFAVEYAMAKLWMSWGVRPQAMIGHSVGEYVAACLSGVFSRDDALRLVAGRARLVQTQPAGSMLAVKASPDKIAPLLDASLSVAAVNSPTLCVVSGPLTDIKQLEQTLAKEGVISRPLNTSHAFHSAMMDPVVAPFTAMVESVKLRAPQIPFVSNLTGRWITEAEARSCAYWAGHLRQTVRFSDGLAELLADPARLFLEVGPGQTLSTFARQHQRKGSSHQVVTSLSTGQDQPTEPRSMLAALGKLWLAGVEVNWKSLHPVGGGRRIPLPTYPFERQRYWVQTSGQPTPGAANLGSSPRTSPLAAEDTFARIEGGGDANGHATNRAEVERALAGARRNGANSSESNSSGLAGNAQKTAGPLQDILDQQLELMREQMRLLKALKKNTH